MNLSEIKQILTEGNIQLTKSLGQNFLHDGNQLRRITAAAGLAAGDRVLEIGPGLGPLTELLLQSAAEVFAIEKDARLVALLQSRFSKELQSEPPKLRLLNEDALEYLRHSPPDLGAWKVVSNLPYSVASPLLVELAENPHRPALIVVTLQIEVARRILAPPGDPDYGLLTLLLQLDYQPGTMFKIPSGCFFPPPDVDSACITWSRRGEMLLPESLKGAFKKIVKRAFSQRRKMMRKLLKQDWPAEALEQAYANACLEPAIRAEQVALEQFVILTKTLGGARAQSPDEIFDVVNERDEVVGQNTRGEVHRLGLMHRAVHVLVFNREGKVFLQKRSLKKDRQPGRWDSSASGHLDSGEAYDACAVRELREEIGLKIQSPPTPLFKIAAGPDTDMEHVWVYRHESEGPFTLHPDEIERGDWFRPEEVDRWMARGPDDFAAAFRHIWARQRGPHPGPSR